jgi:DNA-directed RNA polymerase specialized sigma24 family protein
MTEQDGTKLDFARRVQPSLQAMARYAALKVGPVERDRVVQDALIRAWHDRATYDESGDSMTAWLLRITDEACRRPRARRTHAPVVELVEDPAMPPPAPDFEVEVALDGLDLRGRQVVDLHYFVGLDDVTAAEVMQVDPQEIPTTLRRALSALGTSTGEDDVDRVDQRLVVAAGRWQDEQFPPPDVPVASLDRPLATRARPRVLLAAAGVVVLVAGGILAAERTGSKGDPTTSPSNQSSAPSSASAAPPPPQTQPASVDVVPWRDLEPGHPVFRHVQNGLRTTPFDDVVVSGTIRDTLRPGQTLVFDVGLTSPGVVPLHPCPDYTVDFGTHSVTRGLNCRDDPFYAAQSRPNGTVSPFRPVLPAGVTVFFRIAVVVPDDAGPQQVLWSLEGPRRKPGFSGTVDVTG